MTEAEIMRRVMLAASQAGVTLWRNNTGKVWTGEVETLGDGAVLIRRPRRFDAGLCKGSSDLIGLRPVVITAAMVGQTLAQFVALETKTERGRVRPEQQQFVEFVLARGGIGAIVRQAADLPGLWGGVCDAVSE